MSKANFFITIAFAAIAVGVWALINQPEREPSWPDKIQGFSFSPMRAGHDPSRDLFPSANHIDDDLMLLEGKAHAIRSYTVEGVMGEIPALARRHDLNVALGAWIRGDPERDAAEVKRLIHIAARNRNVVRVFIGNESLLRGDLEVGELIKYIDQARAALDMPVSTAEPWHIWLKYPQLVEHVDFIGTHMLPYWEGVPMEAAVDYVVSRMDQLTETYPGMKIVIGEVGWPSNGRTRGGAVASEANEAIFLRRFLALAAEENYTYYIMEAFDQPWKQSTEGAVGAYWGVYDFERREKFPFSEPIVEIPEWRMLAGISVLLAVITLALLLSDSTTMKSSGRGFLAIIAYAVAMTLVWVIYQYVDQYLTIGSIIIGVLLVIGMIGVIAVLLTEAHEWAEALFVTQRRRPFLPLPLVDAAAPKISIHVAAYNEPPEMVKGTLDALARLDYPDFEVIVVDNNTKDPAVWQPVEAHCAMLGERFRFFHVDPLSGFKAGALNFALAQTAADADIIGVIDSDYMVEPLWLRDLVPHFDRERIAIVQAPQDYRDGNDNWFKAICYAEYSGFFHIGMVTRNDRNAIIQHGTMTLVRRTVLEEVGGWGEWTITEDAELGLRIFERGYEAGYISDSYGKGLMPDTFSDYRKQRFRWAYGAIQIMRHHARSLIFGIGSKLSRGQRYHFVAGWLPWIADGVNLFFTLAALFWSAGMLLAPDIVDPPLIIFSALPMALFIFKIAKMIYLYRAGMDATFRQTLAAALAGLALSHTISKAVIQGFKTRSLPFFRTPKMENAAMFIRALAAAWEELLLMAALWLGAWGIADQIGLEALDIYLWFIVLLIQSVPYSAAVLLSLISGMPKLSFGLKADVQSSLSETPRLQK
jgi:exo-beta-1,3-glucanase (GH17 family)/cellulose synthase/poly-beta-1,6-N-acetylglucosamine synthase-like glycosyltransferase